MLLRLAIASAAVALLACPSKPTLSMDALTPPPGNVGTPYSVTFSASGAKGAVAFTSKGTLPPGLTLATSGTLSGTPSAAGTYSFDIVATDSVTSVSASFGIEVFAHAPPSIATTSLPDGAVGRAYSATLVGEAGQTPYTWSLLSGSLPAGLSLSSSGALSGTPTAAGVSSFQVQLVDAKRQSAMASLSISILNPPAVATAAIDDGYAGLSYAFAFQATSGTAPYTWDLSAGALPAGLSLSSSGVVTGTPQVTGVSSFTVRVTDSAGLTGEKALAVTVYEPLVLQTAALPDGVVGIPYSADLVATGGKTPLAYSIASGALPTGISLSGAALGGIPLTAQSANFTLQVADQNGRTASRPFTVTIWTGLAITTSSLPIGYVGRPYSHGLVAAGGATPYAWSVLGGALPTGVALGGSGALSGTPGSAGSFTFTAKVQDNVGTVATRDLTLTILDPPALTTDALPDGYAGVPYSQMLAATGGLAPLSFAVSAGALPTGMSLTSSGVLSGSPTSTGAASFTISVTDANAVTTSRSYTLASWAVPQVTTTSLPDAYATEAYSQTLSATGGKPSLTWSVATGSAAPFSLSAAGTLSGTPATAGTASFSVQVTDPNGQSSAAQPLAVAIRSLPSVTTAALPDGYVGDAYSTTLAATGGVAPLTWSISSGTLPAGISLDASTGRLSGTPTASGTANITVSVSDANGRTASKALSLTVLAVLTVSTSSLPDGYVTLSYNQALQATGGRAPYTWSVTAGSLPAGLTLTSGTIAGTPTAATSSLVTFRVSDGSGHTASKQLSIATYNLPSISTTSLPDAYNGYSYSRTLSASGGKPTLSWTFTGTLPTGLGLSADGILSGVVGTSASSQTFTVRATDANGQYAEQALALAVYHLPLVTTSSLPDGTVGLAYDQTLSASNGKAPYSWSVTGALPPDLTLDSVTGRISGTPTVAGTWSFTAFAYDANGRYGNASLSITIGGGTSIQLPVACWNLEWFGDPAYAPNDDALQLANVTGVIADAGFPLWGVEEVVSTAQFQTMLANLPGYSGFLADDPRVPGGTTYYAPSEQKVGVVYQTARVTPVSAQLILTANQDLFAYRPPLRVDFEVDGGGPLTLVVLHMKAGTTGSDWNRRADAGVALKGYLDQNLPSDRALVVGDWNDDVDQSIAAGYDTPYRPLINDSAHYHFVTDYLTYAGYSSEIGYSNIIDHQLATNELDALQVGNPEVVRPDLWTAPVASYGTTTSDHYPVVSRYAFASTGGADAGTPLLYLNEVLFDEPSDGGYQLYDYEFVEVRNAGDGPADLSGWQIWDALNGTGVGPGYMRHTFAPGTTLDPGKAIVVFGAAAGIPPGLTNAVPASTNSLSLHPSDSARLLTPAGVQQDIYTWTYNWGDGLSANRSPDGDPYGVWLPHTSVSPPLLSSPGTRADGTSW